MKTISLILSLLLYISVYCINAQECSLKIHTPEDDWPWGSVISPDNDLFVVSWRGTFEQTGSFLDYFFNYRQILYKINDQLIVDDSLTFDILDNYDLSMIGIYLAGDSLMVWGNALKLSDSTNHFAMLALTKDFEIIDLATYGTYSDSVFFITNTKVDHGNLIFAGYNQFTGELHLVKTDESGNLIDTSQIDYLGSPWPNICYLSSVDKLLCGRMQWLGLINNIDMKLDTIFYPPIFNRFFSRQFFTSYDSYRCILPGDMIKDFPEMGRNPACLLFDTLAQINDSIIFDLPFENNSSANADFIDADSIYFGAIENSEFLLTTPYEFNPIDRSYAIYKFNFYNDIIWQRKFGGDANYECLHVIANFLGGCTFYGTYYDWRNNPNWERDIVLYSINGEGSLVNVSETDTIQLQVYPNPVNDKLIIQSVNSLLRSGETGELRLINSVGNYCRIIPLSGSSDINIDVSDMIPGLYILQIILNDKTSYSEKIVIY